MSLFAETLSVEISPFAKVKTNDCAKKKSIKSSTLEQVIKRQTGKELRGRSLWRTDPLEGTPPRSRARTPLSAGEAAV